MRVLVVTNAYPSASNVALGTFVKDQVESVRALGIDVEVLYIDRAGQGSKAYRGLEPVLRSAVDGAKPDLVHVTYGGVLADIVARKLSDLPLVVSFCGNDLLGEGGATLPRRLIGRYSVVCSHRAARRARGIIVKSSVLEAALPGSIDRGRVSIIPSGVDLDTFQPADTAVSRAELGWAAERKHVLFTNATNRTEKRFGLAQAAVEQARADGLDIELHVLDGVPHERVPLWLNASDSILLTSTHEGSPNVVKEALACDVAVVSTDVGDVRERIEGIGGCYVADATPADLAGKLRLALAGGRVRSRAAVAELSLPRTAERIRDVYAAVLDRSG